MVYCIVTDKQNSTDTKGVQIMECLKHILEQMEKAEAESDAADEAWEKDPQDEELESVWNVAYKKYHYYHTELVKGIVRESLGLIDAKTARKMIAEKRDKLTELFDKFEKIS